MIPCLYCGKPFRPIRPNQRFHTLTCYFRHRFPTAADRSRAMRKLNEARWASLDGPIARLRRNQGMTQQELADKLGLSRGTVSRIENGRAWPRWRVWVRLAKILAVPIDELKGGRA